MIYTRSGIRQEEVLYGALSLRSDPLVVGPTPIPGRSLLGLSPVPHASFQARFREFDTTSRDSPANLAFGENRFWAVVGRTINRKTRDST